MRKGTIVMCVMVIEMRNREGPLYTFLAILIQGYAKRYRFCFDQALPERISRPYP